MSARVVPHWNVVVLFPEPLIGSDTVRGIVSRTREHAVMQAQAMAAERRWPRGCTFHAHEAEPLEVEVSTDWVLFHASINAPVRRALAVTGARC